uniref:DDHD domain-containing protein n=1 Tax=Gongylonema pulchrum TaxID=637853 RepID=A0A183EKD3_9BILA
LDGDKHRRNMSAPPTASIRNHSPRSATNSESSSTEGIWEPLAFRTNVTFLIGCPLALLLAQRKFYGYEAEPLECSQLYNLYYSLDPCGARLEPVLNPQLAMLLPVNVPRYRNSSSVNAQTDRQFIRSESVPLSNLSNVAFIPSEIDLGPAIWNKKRTKYKV